MLESHASIAETDARTCRQFLEKTIILIIVIIAQHVVLCGIERNLLWQCADEV